MLNRWRFQRYLSNQNKTVNDSFCRKKRHISTGRQKIVEGWALEHETFEHEFKKENLKSPHYIITFWSLRDIDTWNWVKITKTNGIAANQILAFLVRTTISVRILTVLHVNYRKEKGYFLFIFFFRLFQFLTNGI